MQFDFLPGQNLNRCEMVVPHDFTRALAQSNRFWSGSHSTASHLGYNFCMAGQSRGAPTKRRVKSHLYISTAIAILH